MKKKFTIIGHCYTEGEAAFGKRRQVRCGCTHPKANPTDHSLYDYFYSNNEEFDCPCPVCKHYYFFKI